MRIPFLLFFFLPGFWRSKANMGFFCCCCFLINPSTKRFTALMCWSINWYSDKPPFSWNVLIRLILSPKLCSWEVSAMSSRLSPAQSPSHVEIIGLNAFTASSAPLHWVSIGNGAVGKWPASNAGTEKKWKKKGKKRRERRGGLLLQCRVKHYLKYLSGTGSS